MIRDETGTGVLRMQTLQAKDLTLVDVHRLLKLQRQLDGSFTPLLSLEALTKFEHQELGQIRNDFDHYLTESRVSEGMVKALTIFPLLRLAGFYRFPIKISLEENIEKITIVDQDTEITGRLDILSVSKSQPITTDVYFWVLVIESKNSGVDPLAGLPQLLTHAYKSLEYQESVWGVATNGARYQFVYTQQGNPPIYQLMPFLSLMDSEPAIQILQILKSICNM